MRRFAELPAAERAAIARRLRLEWACQGDLGAVEGVERMIAAGAAIAAGRRANLRPPLEPEARP